MSNITKLITKLRTSNILTIISTRFMGCYKSTTTNTCSIRVPKQHIFLFHTDYGKKVEFGVQLTLEQENMDAKVFAKHALEFSMEQGPSCLRYCSPTILYHLRCQLDKFINSSGFDYIPSLTVLDELDNMDCYIADYKCQSVRSNIDKCWIMNAVVMHAGVVVDFHKVIRH